MVRVLELSERLMPIGMCLTRALTAYVLLRLLGQPCRICIGVGRKAQGQLHSHAWLECRGRVLIGGSIDGLTALPLRTAVGALGRDRNANEHN